MTSLTDNPGLPFLKYNNAQSITKVITEDMINNDILSIKLNAKMFNSNKMMAIYWKFNNFNMENTGITIFKDSLERISYRTSQHYSLVVPFLIGELNQNNLDSANNPVYILSFTSDVLSVFCYNSYEVIEDSIEFKIKKRNDKFKINYNSSIEIVIQYEVNPNNLPDDLEILKLDDFEMVFDNLPLTLKKIIINDYSIYNSLKKIKQCFPKIPFGCLIENRLGQEITLD
jgi:hypothetical protein